MFSGFPVAVLATWQSHQSRGEVPGKRSSAIITPGPPTYLADQSINCVDNPHSPSPSSEMAVTVLFLPKLCFRLVQISDGLR